MSWLAAPDDAATCLVTGASSGIGAAIARELAARRYGVTLVARREERLRALASEIASAHSVRAEALPCNLADARARRALADRIRALGLRVDVLVNNAGLGSYGAFVELDPAREVEQVRVMCEAVIDLCGMFVPAMAARRSGGVLIISSALGFQPAPGYATYGAVKAFSLRFGEALHSELAHSSVAVTTLCPGPVQTDFFSVNGPQPVQRVIPGRMWRTAEEVARAGVDGLKRNRRVVIPGTAMRILTASGRLTPRAAQLRLLDMVLRAGATGINRVAGPTGRWPVGSTGPPTDPDAPIGGKA